MIEKKLLWAPQDGSTYLVENNSENNHNLLVDADADTGQLHSFDAWDEIEAVCTNNTTDPNEHTIRRTFPDAWKRFPHWAEHSDNGYFVLLRTSNSTFRKLAGHSLALYELWGVRYK